MQYRKEIDGLRAVAVLAVLLNHSKSPFAIGGFVGVDIFFVISGFLITFIMVSDIERNQFTLAKFYERRVRRIIPALLAVSATTTVLVFLFLYPQMVYRYVDSLIATLLFVANIFFYFEQDYFAPSGDVELLLHTWTLGVEEQFYIFFPIVLFFSYRMGKAIPVITVTLLASLVLAMLAGDTAAAFYLLPYRAWEFGLGALMAIVRFRHPELGLRGIVIEALAIIGLALMLIAIVVTPKGAPAEVLSLAVAGAVLIVSVGDHSRVCGRLLGNPLFVYIGAISYSLYLWHQPVFAIVRIRTIGEMGFVDHLLPLALVFLLSHLSYRFVETPFRNRKAMGMRRVWINLGAMALPTILVGYVLMQGITLPVLVTDEQPRQYITAGIGSARSATWRALDSYETNGRPVRIAVAGNSHAKDMFNAIRLSAFGEDFDFVPLISNRLCRLSGRDKILSLLLPMQESADDVTRCETNFEYIDNNLDTLDGIVLAPLWDDTLLEALPAFLGRMRASGIPVLIAGNTARFPDVSRTINNLVMGGVDDIDSLNARLTALRWDESGTNRRLKELADAAEQEYLDRESLVCPGGECELTADYGEVAVFDSGHWTLYGAAIYGSRLNGKQAILQFVDRVTASAGE